MSKQASLLNFFTKSPASNLSSKNSLNSPNSASKNSLKTPNSKNTPNSKKTPDTNKKTPKSSVKSAAEKENINSSRSDKKSRKRIIVPEDSPEHQDSDDESSPKKPKDYPLNSDDSGDEFVPDATEMSSESENEAEATESEDPTENSEEESPVQSKKRKRNDKSNKPNKKSALLPRVTPSKDKVKSAAPLSQSNESQASGDSENWTHLKCEFLKPDKIRDAKRRRPSDPNYDPRTLYVPEDYLRSLTPAMRQWWEMKSKHFDCILFFKVGKFYEFYNMDAVVGVKELNITFMKGDYAHCGFPEIAYGRFSANLVDKGYKVARVEQTETPDMMAERCKKLSRPTKFDKVVKREICQMTTKGTQIYTVVDGQCKEANSKYLLAIVEKEVDSVKSNYGVCFVDTSIGIFYIGQFEDDRHCSRIRTLISMYPPAQILVERNRVSKRTEAILNSTVAAVLKESLAPETEFLSSSKTLSVLAEKQYFPGGELPEPLKQFIGDGDSLNLTSSDESELGVRCLGAVVWYLSTSLLDHQLLSMGQFQVYVPVDLKSPECPSEPETCPLPNRLMVLDAVTLKNLNVIENGSGGKEGTLFNKLDHCCTPFGKRLLHQWICSPLTNVASIEARQKAVSVLKDNPELIKEARGLLSKLPDLERLLFRIHAQSSKGLPDDHPDTRAIMFEEKTYSKRKITEFISVLNGFQVLQQVATLFQGYEIEGESSILIQCTNFPSSSPSGNFPDLTEHLKFFKNAFDHEEAEKEGNIIPSSGVDPEYDEAMENLESLAKKREKYLKQQCEHFGCKVTYVGTDRKRFQLEVPESAARRAGDGYDIQGQRKGFRRFWTPETKDFLEKQQAAEEVKNNVLHNLCNRIFSRFSERFSDWNEAVQCIAVLDVLLSLAEYYLSQDCDMCIPSIRNLRSNEKPFVNLKDGRYPCVVGDEDFIPNDTLIDESASLVLLTGPNMGGKSTLMRQLGLIVIMAQMGSAVPATSLEMSVVDRIFTRIGANDDIMAGDSTFYLELCETSSILHHASLHSLVLIDELGRGTSTYDGTAIAAAVLTELCQMHCRTIFSTHYHSLVEDFKDNPRVHLAHMACMAEKEEDTGEETVTFLYKVAEGACPKSYGFNAARLAGIPSHITKEGSCRASQVEVEAKQRRLFRDLMCGPVEDLRQIISSL